MRTPSFAPARPYLSQMAAKLGADTLLPHTESPPSQLEPHPPVSMSPASGDVAQTPEPKSTSGFASVLKSLTGSRPTRNPNPGSPASQSGSTSLRPSAYPQSATYGGPPDYEHLYDRLKPGNPLADRLAAAEALRHAVQDYPLSGVGGLVRSYNF